jgi:RHS repeat-associated protein
MAYYYTRDHLGSVREMCSSTGAIVARYSYDPYGRTTLVSGSNLATKQYAGMYAHQTSGLNLTWFRAYDGNTGRWLNRDPLAEQGGLNLYGYVLDGPTYSVDSLGLCTEVHELFLQNGNPGWHLQSFKLGSGIPYDFTMTYYTVSGVWTAQVYVLCQCKCGLVGTK